MNNYINYINLVIGMVLGQAFSTAVLVYFIQKKKAIAYRPAFTEYVGAEVGTYVIALLMLFMAMFLLADYISPQNITGMSASMWQWKVKVASNFRLFALAFGTFAPLIGLLFFKKGIKAIQKKDDEINKS